MPDMTTFLHTMVRITDPDKSRAFYEALGFEFGHDMPIVRDGELEATNYFFSLPGQDDVLELTLNHDGRSYELGTGYGHIAIGVDDLSATLEQLAGVGIEPEKPPYSVREGGSKLCFVRDPDGYRIEIIGRGERRAPPRSTTEIVDAAGFEITITKQGWLDPAAADHDLCSHGDVRLAIGDQMIAPSDGGGDYGISKAALALLRTLHSDHSPEHPVAERLVPHGCGTILMMGCPIGIDWSVSHSAGRVRITDVVRYDGTVIPRPSDSQTCGSSFPSTLTGSRSSPSPGWRNSPS
jgi:lactoylglutathione lyase